MAPLLYEQIYRKFKKFDRSGTNVKSNGNCMVKIPIIYNLVFSIIILAYRTMTHFYGFFRRIEGG